MEITCPSCSTIYEIGEDQLTEQGVNFRCSQCGYVFKVQRTQKDVAGPIQVQRVSTGKVLAYDDMAEVQRAIVEGDLSRQDQLSERGSQWTELGQFPNFAPFFDIVDRSRGSSVSGASSTDSSASEPSPSSTQGFSPLRSWDSGEHEAVTGNQQRDGFGTSSTQTFESGDGNTDVSAKPLKSEHMQETQVSSSQQQDGQQQRASVPPGFHEAETSFSEQAEPAQSQFEDRTTTHYSGEDEDLLAYEQKLSGGGAGRYILLLILLMILGATAAALLFREEIGNTTWGANLPYFGEAAESSEVTASNETDPAEGEESAAVEEAGAESEQAGAAAQGSVEEAAETAKAAAEGTTEADEAGDEADSAEQDKSEQTAANDQQQVAAAEAPEEEPESPAPSEQAEATQAEPPQPPPAQQQRQPEPEPVEISQMSADSAKRVGLRALQTGDIDRAVEALQRSADLQPNFDTFVKLGEAQNMAGNLSAAHSAYSSALDQNPRYMPALFGIADVERAMGRRNAAIDRYREILRISPSGDRGEQARNALRGLGADVE